MSDSRYQYEKVTVIKVIVENSEGKILLVQEPPTNEWMPLHWGLPGGKPLVKESLYGALRRKMKEELAQDIEPEGIFRIEELLIEGKTVLMFHAVAKVGQVNLSGESKSYKWVDAKEVEKMNGEEFTEYFNKKLILDYLTGEKKLADFDLIEAQNYYDLEDEPEYKKWFESGRGDVK